MQEIEIIIPSNSPGDFLSDSLRSLTAAVEKLKGKEEFYGLGGPHGYGSEFENETFLLHPYCWCEQEDCPWCGECQVGFPEVQHGPDCYQSKLDSLRRKHGEKTDWGYSVGFDNKKYDRARTKLCKAMGLNPRFGSEVHCTCGAVDEAQKEYDACQCDWHLGKGQFRFGKATPAPNFWHKPTGLMVWWYKYIGRDMELSQERSDVAEILAECLRSLAPARAGQGRGEG